MKQGQLNVDATSTEVSAVLHFPFTVLLLVLDIWPFSDSCRQDPPIVRLDFELQLMLESCRTVIIWWGDKTRKTKYPILHLRVIFGSKSVHIVVSMINWHLIVVILCHQLF